MEPPRIEVAKQRKMKMQAGLASLEAHGRASPGAIAHIKGIDGMRALAVIAVIIFHFVASALPGGFSGVDVFFVISGYVVTSSLLRAPPTGLKNLLVDFYAKRLLRIYPALILCLIVCGALYTLLVPASALGNTSTKTAIAAFFGMSNFALIWFNDGYFSPTVEFNAFTHTWSLAVEEQFYLVFPLLLWLSLTASQKAIKNGIALLSFASLLYAAYITPANFNHAYYLLPSRFWELGAGSILASLHYKGRLPITSSLVADSTVAIGITLVLLSFQFSDKHAFPFPWACLPVVGSLLSICGVASGHSWISRHLLENSAAVYIGEISYSLYLWHWPVLVLLRWTTGVETWAHLAAAAVITAIASTLSYHWLEDPIRRNLYLKQQPKPFVLSRGLFVLTLSSILCTSLFLAQPYLSLSVTSNRSIWSPEAQLPPGDGAAEPANSRGRLFVLGDSHAWAYGSMLARLAREESLTLHTYRHLGCSIANLRRVANSACARQLESSLKEIERLAVKGDLVFLAGLKMNRLGDQWASFDLARVSAEQEGEQAAQDRETALREAERVISRLESVGLILIIDAPKPVFRSPPFRCADWFNASNPVCASGFTVDKAFLLKHREPAMASLAVLSRRHPRMVIWDPFDEICPKTPCSAFLAGRPLFFDGDHLSGYGNTFLYGSFRSKVVAHLSPNGHATGMSQH